MEKFTHKFTASGIAYKLPSVPNFVIIKMFQKETTVSLKELSYPELCEYAEAVKQSIIKKHKKQPKCQKLITTPITKQTPL